MERTSNCSDSWSPITMEHGQRGMRTMEAGVPGGLRESELSWLLLITTWLSSIWEGSCLCPSSSLWFQGAKERSLTLLANSTQMITGITGVVNGATSSKKKVKRLKTCQRRTYKWPSSGFKKKSA